MAPGLMVFVFPLMIVHKTKNGGTSKIVSVIVGGCFPMFSDPMAVEPSQNGAYVQNIHDCITKDSSNADNALTYKTSVGYFNY